MEQPNVTNGYASRDGQLQSLWQKAQPAHLSNVTSFEPDKVYDALIVGAGITGLTTALLLQKQGKQCVLAEGHTIGYGTTGGTTAHLNTYFDTPYNEIESDFDLDAAKLVHQSSLEAFEIIKRFVAEYGIDCDLEFKDGYLYAETDDEVSALNDVLAASKRAGVDVEEAERNGVAVPFKKSIVFKGQGQFHPLKYVYGLAYAFLKAGGVILENTLIRDSKLEDGIYTAKSDDLELKARHLVYATHMPPGINILSVRCAPYRSYVLGLKLTDENAYPQALSYDSKDPYHYFRTHVVDGQKYLILGGEDHKTGHDDPEAAFRALEEYARKYYPIAEVSYRWSSQYYSSVDGLPYIGHLPSNDDIYVATGYNGNGMMYGTIAGKIISDMIVGNESPYAKLFSPSRLKPVAGFVEFVKENADVAYRFVADRFSAEKIEALEHLERGNGTIIKHDGDNLAVYKDIDGRVTALNPVCTHAGCIVNFNHTEKSWDCPCHGGRFDINGKVITGPPRADLQKVEIEEKA